ncbi:hypothetical protein QL285_013866 [Trifolium repens]|nr:hypothetical protein QL285_013866 [Trifolium repens]
MHNLVEIDLKHSFDLIEIPDLSSAPNLQIVNLSCCSRLSQLHPSVFTRPKLRKLLLSKCVMIESLKTDIHSKSLEVLDLSYCYSLVEFSVTSEEMTSLSLCGTAICEFPSSVWRNSKLTKLYLDECKKLNIVMKKLSTDLGLRSLTTLDLSQCTEINTSNLWFILDGTPSLYHLNLKRCCNLETLPDNIQNNSLLEILELDECSKLKSLPKLPTSLKQLTAFNCTYLDTNILHKFRVSLNFSFNNKHRRSDICYLPGGQVPSEFKFQTTKASIDIPHIPKSGLYGFIFCIVLSEGLNFRKQRVGCTIYEHGKEILDLKKLFVIENTFGKTKTLILDHVLLCSWIVDSYRLVNMGNESDHYYNLSFEFKHLVPGGEYASVGKEEWSTLGIKGCGVFPVYGISRVDIFELQSSSQFSHESDINEFDIDESESDRVEIVELQFTFSSGVEIVELQSSAQVSRESEIDENVEDEDDILKLLKRFILFDWDDDRSDIGELKEQLELVLTSLNYKPSFVFGFSDIVELIHKAIGAELDVDEFGIIELTHQAIGAGFDIDKSDIVELIHQAIGDEFDIDESDFLELLPEGYGAEDRDQQQIPPKEKEALLMIMKLKLEALPMKIKMNNRILFLLEVTLLFLQMKMKMNINKLICRGSTDQNEKEDLDDKSCCACSIM